MTSTYSKPGSYTWNKPKEVGWVRVLIKPAGGNSTKVKIVEMHSSVLGDSVPVVVGTGEGLSVSRFGEDFAEGSGRGPGCVVVALP